MTRTAIRNAFRKMDSTEQAIILKDLAAALAESLSDEDKGDARTFDERRSEEASAQPWSQVRARVDTGRRRKRTSS